MEAKEGVKEKIRVAVIKKKNQAAIKIPAKIVKSLDIDPNKEDWIFVFDKKKLHLEGFLAPKINQESLPKSSIILPKTKTKKRISSDELESDILKIAHRENRMLSAREIKRELALEGKFLSTKRITKTIVSVEPKFKKRVPYTRTSKGLRELNI